MKRTTLLLATTVLLAAAPASAQLLGGSGGLGGAIGGALGGAGPIGGLGQTLGGTMSGQMGTAVDHHVDRRSGHASAHASGNAAGNGAVDSATSSALGTLGASGNANGSASGSAGADADLIGTDGVRYARQCGDGGPDAVELTAAVIRYDDALRAGLDRVPRILRIEHPLDDDWPVPFRTYPFEVGPRDRPVEVAGDPQRANAKRRMQEGIPVGPNLLRKIRAIADASGAPWLLG